MKNLDLTSNKVSYDDTKPIKETIKASGRFLVTAGSVACESAELTRDVVILARETLRESVIEAKVDAKKAEINGLKELHQLELEYQQTLASLK